MTSTPPPTVERPFNRGVWGEPGKPRWNNGLRLWGGTSLTSSSLRWTKTNIIREVVATGGPPGGATEVQIDGMAWGWGGWRGWGMVMLFFFLRQNILGDLGSCSVFLFSCFFFFTKIKWKLLGF